MARTFVCAAGAVGSRFPAGLVRGSFAAIALALIALTVGFGFRQEWATRLWIWDDQRMNFIFLASIAAAVCAPALWVTISGEFAAWAGVASNGIVVGTLASGYLMSRVLRDLMPDALSTGLVFMCLTPLAVLSFRWSHSQPVRDARTSPRFVRISFIAFVVLLVSTGGALLLQVDNVFPWHLDPPVSTLFGCFFLGAATYFMYALRRPSWVIAAGALWSFLAYDIILAIPYLGMLGENDDAAGYGGPYGSSPSNSAQEVNDLSLVIYLLVLGISAMIALYAFFIAPETRILRRGAEDPLGSR